MCYISLLAENIKIEAAACAFMAKLGIMGAMDEEVNILVKSIKKRTSSLYASMRFFSGILNGKDLVVVKSGAGKVNAAICAQILISVFGVRSIIFIGVAGAVDEALDIGDIVVSSDCVQHDFDAQALGYELGQIYGSKLKFFRADEKLIRAVLEASKGLKVRCVKGRILTGDKFVTNSSDIEKLKKTFGGACIEMEGAAVAYTCALNKVPFVIIRSISDRADHSAAVDFKKFLPKAAQVSSSIVTAALAGLDAK